MLKTLCGHSRSTTLMLLHHMSAQRVIDDHKHGLSPNVSCADRSDAAPTLLVLSTHIAAIHYHHPLKGLFAAAGSQDALQTFHTSSCCATFRRNVIKRHIANDVWSTVVVLSERSSTGQLDEAIMLPRSGAHFVVTHQVSDRPLIDANAQARPWPWLWPAFTAKFVAPQIPVRERTHQVIEAQLV